MYVWHILPSTMQDLLPKLAPRPPCRPSSPSPIQHRRVSSVTLSPLEAEKPRLPHMTGSRKCSRSPIQYSLSPQKILLVCLTLLCAGYGLVHMWSRHQLYTASHYEGAPHSAQTTTHKLDSIPVRGNIRHSFKSLGSHEHAVSAKWQHALSTLEDASRTLSRQWFEESPRRLFPLPVGIPGTGIDTKKEAKALQDYLDCTTSNGEWAHDPAGQYLNGSSLPVHKQSSLLSSCDKTYYKHTSQPVNDLDWNVRPSLKWHWQPSPSCGALLKPKWMKDKDITPIQPLISRSSLCKYLRHKNVLLVGDSPTHYLIHDLLLDWTSKRPLTCYGDLYCKEHAICADEIALQDSSAGNQWQDDNRPHGNLQDPPLLTPKSSISVTSSSVSNSTRTYGTVLRYRRADSMFFNSSPSHVRHQPAFIHPHTGVRDINMYSVADGRRSDVSILYKAPVAFPRSFEGVSAVPKRLSRMAADIQKPGADLRKKMQKLIDLSTLATLEIWLPEVLESLRAFKAPPAPTDSLIIYRGGWRMQEGCGDNSVMLDSSTNVSIVGGDGPVHYLQQLDLGHILVTPANAGSVSSVRLQNVETIYFNLQTVLQNHLMRTIIAPQLGMPFIDLETATGIWRSGFVGGAGAVQMHNQSLDSVRTQPSSKSNDCLRMCLPSPGLSLETLFLGSLYTIFDWGWGGEVRSRTWTGPAFVPARSRKQQNRPTRGLAKQD